MAGAAPQHIALARAMSVQTLLQRGRAPARPLLHRWCQVRYRSAAAQYLRIAIQNIAICAC